MRLLIAVVLAAIVVETVVVTVWRYQVSEQLARIEAAQRPPAPENLRVKQ